jgi:uncharacterized SAM-binding protein YcdF (DUF218 family)
VSGGTSRPPWFALLLSALALGWLGGFAWFAYAATRPPGPPPDADGIVVLTGGAGRIDAALALLDAHHARDLLISGVGGNLGLDAVMPHGREPTAEIAQHVALGHAATSTVGNALETAAWARTHGLRSLIVVTAGYHMRRALAEIGQALPQVRLYPYPVLPPALAHPARPATMRLLAEEYVKWLAVAAGLTRSAHLREIA